MSFRIVNPESLGKPRGFSHGLLAPEGGRLLFVAGQIANDESGAICSVEFAEQFAQALHNALEVVVKAGGHPTDIARLTVYVTSVDEYLESMKKLGPIFRDLMEGHYPTMALIEVSRLVEERARVEIEATAVLPSDAEESS